MDAQRELEQLIRTEVLSAVAATTGQTLQSECLDVALAPSAANGDHLACVLVVHAQPIESALLQFQPFARGERTGWLLPFVRGWITHALNGSSFRGWVGEIDIDVDDSDRRPTCSLSDLYRFVEYDPADDRFTNEVGRVMARYRLSWCLVAGQHIAGPSVAALELLDRELGRSEPATLLDLFSGTGSVADLCLARGNAAVLSVDLAPVAGLESRTARFGERWRFQSCDVLNDFIFDAETWDLVVADPFYGQVHSFARRLTNLSPGARPARLLINCGKSHLLHAQERLDTELNSAGYALSDELRDNGERAAVFEQGRI